MRKKYYDKMNLIIVMNDLNLPRETPFKREILVLIRLLSTHVNCDSKRIALWLIFLSISMFPSSLCKYYVVIVQLIFIVLIIMNKNQLFNE